MRFPYCSESLTSFIVGVSCLVGNSYTAAFANHTMFTIMSRLIELGHQLSVLHIIYFLMVKNIRNVDLLVETRYLSAQHTYSFERPGLLGCISKLNFSDFALIFACEISTCYFRYFYLSTLEGH